MEIKSIEVDGVEVGMEELVAAYKAEGEREKLREAKREKSFSLDEQRRLVRDAWEAIFRTRPNVPAAEVDAYWVKEVFDDQVIVETPDGLYSYP